MKFLRIQFFRKNNIMRVLMKESNKIITQVVTVFLLFLVNTAIVNAEEHIIDQEGKKFSRTNIVIQAGDTIVFENSDALSHNIHSLTANDAFDLGSFKRNETVSHTFHSKGVHEIECAIHPFMFLTVTVE